MDTADNELYYLEAIHFFVEVLDAFFKEVCELDLVFNVYMMIDLVLSCLYNFGRSVFRRRAR